MNNWLYWKERLNPKKRKIFLIYFIISSLPYLHYAGKADKKVHLYLHKIGKGDDMARNKIFLENLIRK